MSAESDFNKARSEAVAALDAGEAKAIADSLTLLDGLRLAVIARMAESRLQANDVSGLRSLQFTLDGVLADFQRRMDTQVRADIQTGVNAAVELIDKPLQALGVSRSALPLNPASIEAAQMFALDRIKDLTADARTAISGILRRVLGNAITMNEGIREVGASLNSKGVFKSLASRAAVIVRQEILTVQSQVSQSRMSLRAKQMVGSGFELRKSWLTARDLRVRPEHKIAQDKYYGPDAIIGAIPVDEPFTVDDEEIMYPRDPEGSPENVINCRCTSLPVVVREAAAKAA